MKAAIWQIIFAVGLLFLGVAAIKQSEALIALSKRIALIEEGKREQKRIIP